MGIYLPQIFRGNTAGTTKYVPQGQARSESERERLMVFGSKVAPPADPKIMGYDVSGDRGPRMAYGVFPTP